MESKKLPRAANAEELLPGRKHFAEGLAALFLNPWTKTPVTVGILGGSGMGKSSLMSQTESIMLRMAAQLAFPNLLPTEDLPGSIRFNLSCKGGRKYEQIKKAVKDLEIDDLTSPDKEPGEGALLNFLDNYQQKYRHVYKALALMDRKEMFDMKDEKSDSSINKYSLGNIPTILPVWYNAWRYQNEQEAWANLVFVITKGIEKSMTRAQRLRCRWRYVRKRQVHRIYLELLLPVVGALALSVYVLLALRRLFSTSLTYASITTTIVGVLSTGVKQVNSVLKTVTDQIKGNLRVPERGTNLGYQKQAVSDIKFAKEELGEKPSALWKFIAWLWSFCGLCPDNVKGTSIPKSSLPSKNDIRIIVFVENLERCQDTVIWKVLSAVSLELAACDINVILGMDQKIVTRAVTNKFKDSKHPEKLAENYLSKIVQLPLALPNIEDNELENIVKHQLRQHFDYEVIDSNVAEQNQTAESTGNTQCLRDDKKDHVTLNICHGMIGRCIYFLSEVSNLFKPRLSNHPGRQGKKLTTPLKTMLLLPNRSPKEWEALTSLHEGATDSKKFLREWKGFLIYHHVARSILCQREEVRNCPGWQVQLIVWIFCCWQWKDQMNMIIKNWKELVSLPPKPDLVQEDDEEKSLIPNEISLGYIVQRYLKESEVEVEVEVEAEAEKEGRGNGNAEGKYEKKMKMKVNDKGKKEAAEVKTKAVGTVKGKEKEEEKWKKLRDTLIKNDVSMDCIQYFQNFRLHCKATNLPRPPGGNNVTQ